MSVPSLRAVIDPTVRGAVATFARACDVSWTTAWRWTLPGDHPDHCVPLAKHWAAIEVATGGRWKSPGGSFGVKPRRRPRDQHISVAAARKGAATRRRQQAARQ